MTVEIGGAAAVGSCRDPAGLPAGAGAHARLAPERCVRVGA